MCAQESGWKGSKPELFYQGVDRKRNGEGRVLYEEHVNSAVEATGSLEIEGVMLNAPHMERLTEEREEFWNQSDELVETERLVSQRWERHKVNVSDSELNAVLRQLSTST